MREGPQRLGAALCAAGLCLGGQRLLPRALLAFLRPPGRPRPGGAAGGARMGAEPWRMSRTEVRDILNKYEKAVEDDTYFLLQPSKAERALLGDELIRRRAAAVRQARDVNQQFVEAVIQDLPDICAGPDALAPPARPVAAFKCPGEGTPTLPASSYGSLASVFLHLLRDWSATCDHVCR